ncbi:MAG: rhomboid family intramembrane serine protease [Anaerolineaceae bacterium]|nr:rhomboid family intramembrane serine protease [Anaerolineaceae bacterium]
MIPIRDQIRTRQVPVINYLLIALNVIIFVFEWLAGATTNNTALLSQLAFTPATFLAAPANPGNLASIFTSMFMHAGWLHLGGNMLYLWIFGDNVEDRLGHIPYLIFYLAGGVFAALAHAFINPASTLPTVGASGAIAAVLGAYLVFYPHSRVQTFIPLGYFMTLKALPAYILLAFWFVLQLFNGVLSLGAAGDMGGTAFWAHIGGFVVGVVVALVVGKGRDADRYQPQW